MTAHILLQDPKYPHNVGGALRAAACFGADVVWYTGDRLNKQLEGMKRLPREERMRNYGATELNHSPSVYRPLLGPLSQKGDMIPVCIEIGLGTESLPQFEHPENAIYVFGPEDGSVTPGLKSACHRFVSIPTLHCTNLAAAVYIVLYDRLAKSGLSLSKYHLKDGYFNHEEVSASLV